jgi:hypothetical protein
MEWWNGGRVEWWKSGMVEWWNGGKINTEAGRTLRNTEKATNFRC